MIEFASNAIISATLKTFGDTVVDVASFFFGLPPALLLQLFGLPPLSLFCCRMQVVQLSSLVWGLHNVDWKDGLLPFFIQLFTVA